MGRQSQLLFVLVSVAAAIAAAGACGGTAVVDGVNDSGGGGTGTGASSSTTSVGGTTTTSSTSSTGGMTPSPLCKEACDALLPCNTTSDGCVDNCSAAGAGCEDLYDAFLECTLDNTTSVCTWPAFSCQNELFTYVDCRGAPPVQGDCQDIGPDDCQCTLFDAANHSYDSFCSNLSQGGFCDCVADGEYVGTCWQEPPGECDPYSNCCGALIFTSSPP